MTTTLAQILNRQRRHLERTQRAAWNNGRFGQDGYYRSCVACARLDMLKARIQTMYGTTYAHVTQTAERY